MKRGLACGIMELPRTRRRGRGGASMYNDDAFATMLLTIPLSADRAEYARPLNTAEYDIMIGRV